MNGQDPTSAELITSAKKKLTEEILELETKIKQWQADLKFLKSRLKKLEK